MVGVVLVFSIFIFGSCANYIYEYLTVKGVFLLICLFQIFNNSFWWFWAKETRGLTKQERDELYTGNAGKSADKKIEMKNL